MNYIRPVFQLFGFREGSHDAGCPLVPAAGAGPAPPLPGLGPADVQLNFQY